MPDPSKDKGSLRHFFQNRTSKEIVDEIRQGEFKREPKSNGRRAMKENTTKLELLDKITSKSKFSEKDAAEMGEVIKRDLGIRYKAARKRQPLEKL